MTQLLDRLRTALADRYAIEREVGSGGMATVYLAQDLRHHRQVAIKVLRPDLAATLGSDRFHREITIAAQLQHPNILPLLDSGEADGLLYYVMPYVEGQSLRERLAREGELPIADTVRILRDVIDALTEAHANGVVHRDIKPENIMLRGRHALVTDFGVARAVSEATGPSRLTTAGVALGTPAYMAPEQATADPHLDHRVDIYAIGAVAYEMLTGRPVFMGTTPQMVLSAQVTETPDPLTRHREAVPAALEAIVMRCLEKKPADRWQRTDELLPQLEALVTPSGGLTPAETTPVTAARSHRRKAPGMAATAVVLAAILAGWWMTADRGAVTPPTGGIPIAVLVFENPGASDEDAYFSEAIADEVNTQLSKIRGFAVKAHASARRLTLDDASYGEIADQLGAAYLVHGSWHREGDSVRVSARLIVPEREEQLWAAIYYSSWTASGMYGESSEIARQVARQLDVGLAREESARLEARPTENTEAWVAYRRGRFFWNDRTEAGLVQALENFRQATELDSTFALAWAGLADTYSMMPFYGRRSFDAVEAAPLARAAAYRAVALDSQSAEAHTSLAAVHRYFDWDLDASLAEYRLALSLNDNYATAHHWFGALLSAIGRIDEAVDEGRRALELDPLSRIIGTNQGDHLLDAGRNEDALQQYLQVLSLDSAFGGARSGLANTYRALGRFEEALAEYRKANSTVGEFLTHLQAGDQPQATTTLARLLESAAQNRTTPYAMARAYAALEDADSALMWLGRAFDQRSVYVAHTFWAPQWDPLREDPRFRELTSRIRYTGADRR